MIVRILSRGKSFKGLATYLTHDAEKAKTEERVAWTHTLNLAHDGTEAAVHEMLWTSRNAELLKQEAGIRAGGRATENAVKHLSLNWAPDETPTRAHMIETTEDFLRHMKWQDHQALLVAHDDKEHAHVHVMLNVIHPETGLRLDDGFERRRAQEWALEYEREQGRIYCEQRLENIGEREESPTRPAWMAFKNRQQEFERAENTLRENAADFSDAEENPKIRNTAEWKKLKEFQRHEREEFFAEGKAEFSELRRSIYREVREEFRERWGDYYSARRDGLDAEALATMKAELLADQKAMLDTRRDEACQELRETRDGIYRELLDEQREMRLGLRARQEAGLDNALFFDQIENRHAAKEKSLAFRDAATETGAAQEIGAWNAEAEEISGWPRENHEGVKSGADVADRIGTGIGFGLLAFFEGALDFSPGKPAPKPRPPAEPEARRPNLFEAAFEESRARQQAEREEADREWYRKQQSLGE